VEGEGDGSPGQNQNFVINVLVYSVYRLSPKQHPRRWRAGGAVGDVVFVLGVQEHNRFLRRGSDLFYGHEVHQTLCSHCRSAPLLLCVSIVVCHH
jgi:DnaJ-class molecular chaperone